MSEIDLCSWFPLYPNEGWKTQNLDQLCFLKPTPILVSRKQLSHCQPRPFLLQSCLPDLPKDVLCWFSSHLFLLPPVCLRLASLPHVLFSLNFIFSPLIFPPRPGDLSHKGLWLPLYSDNPDVCVSSSNRPIPTLCPSC